MNLAELTQCIRSFDPFPALFNSASQSQANAQLSKQQLQQKDEDVNGEDAAITDEEEDEEEVGKRLRARKKSTTSSSSNERYPSSFRSSSSSSSSDDSSACTMYSVTASRNNSTSNRRPRTFEDTKVKARYNMGEDGMGEQSFAEALVGRVTINPIVEEELLALEASQLEGNEPVDSLAARRLYSRKSSISFNSTNSLPTITERSR
jgi:small-conductance mechanosensitive channel